MKIVDVHCHLESEHFQGRLDEIIAGAKRAGIVKLITNSIEPDQWEQTLGIAKAYPEVEPALGVHPVYCAREHLDRLEELAGARDRGAVAIGEIGLDTKIEEPPLELQRKIFDRQLEIAVEINLPVIIHCRAAFGELIHSLKRIGLPRAGGVLHAFSGSPELALDLMRFGLSFSMGGTLTYRRSRKRDEMLRAIFPDSFLLETDSPDIPPVQHSGEVNYPEYITLNLAGAAEILGVAEEEVSERTTENAAQIFGLTV